MTEQTPPVEVSLPEAYTVLREALGDLARLGRPATGSEARLGMKRRTYGGFDPRSLGFKRFRDFLQAARDAGHIELDDARKGDVAVSLPGAIYRDNNPAEEHRSIRSDLWRAVSDWSGDSTHVVELSRDRVVSFPPLPVPLEPADFADLRARLNNDDPDLVEVQPVPETTQTEWMRRFAREGNLLHLQEALATSNPTREFVARVRSDDSVRRAWGRVLANEVRRYIAEWQKSEPRAAAFDAYSSPRRSGEAMHTLARSDPPSDSTAKRNQSWHLSKHYNVSDLFTPTFYSYSSTSDSHEKGDAEELRQRLHRAIDRMPPRELRDITIPVGYFFDED